MRQARLMWKQERIITPYRRSSFWHFVSAVLLLGRIEIQFVVGFFL